jgi:hypothetical protein
MRAIVILRRADDGHVDGEIKVDGDDATRAFSGWIELLDLLDRAADPPTIDRPSAR